MTTQSRTFQQRTIAAACEDGSLHTLRWFVEMTVPSRLRPRPDARHMPATHPPGHVVTLPVTADDPRRDDDLGLLVGLLTEGNRGRGIGFAPALTTVDVLAEQGLRWYEWGDCPGTVDRVCQNCGSVNHGAADVVAPCPTCKRMEKSQ